VVLNKASPEYKMEEESVELHEVRRCRLKPA
jgi:hypothetical protein